MSLEHRWNDNNRKKNRRTWRKKNPIANLFTKKSHKKGLVLKLGLRGERPGAKSFSHGTGHLNVHNNNI